MQPRGSGNMIAGSWNAPFGLELRDYSEYPYSIFRFRWINYNSERKGKRYVKVLLQWLSYKISTSTSFCIKRLGDGHHWFYWFTPHVPLSLLQWYSLCLSYDAATDKMVAVLNGHKIADFTNRGYEEKDLVSRSTVLFHCNDY